MDRRYAVERRIAEIVKLQRDAVLNLLSYSILCADADDLSWSLHVCNQSVARRVVTGKPAVQFTSKDNLSWNLFPNEGQRC